MCIYIMGSLYAIVGYLLRLSVIKGNGTRDNPDPRPRIWGYYTEQVRKDKKAMDILFNGVDGDMFDNIINCKNSQRGLGHNPDYL